MARQCLFLSTSAPLPLPQWSASLAAGCAALFCATLVRGRTRGACDVPELSSANMASKTAKPAMTSHVSGLRAALRKRVLDMANAFRWEPRARRTLAETAPGVSHLVTPCDQASHVPHRHRWRKECVRAVCARRR